MNESVKLTIRLTPDDMAVLKAHTRRTHLSQSAYLRALIRGYVPKAYPPETLINQSIKTLRHELRVCGHIEASIPAIRLKLKEPAQPPQETKKLTTRAHQRAAWRLPHAEDTPPIRSPSRLK